MADNALFTQQTAPAQLPVNLRPVTPVLMRRGEFVPTLGGNVTVDLGGETVRCEVAEVLSHDVIVALIGTRDPSTGKIVGVVMDKTGHGHKAGSTIAVQRVSNDLGGETWRPVSDREVREQETIERVRADVAATQTAAAAERRDIEMPKPALAPPPGTAHAVPPSEVVVAHVPHGTPAPPAGESRKMLGPRRSKLRHAESEPTHRRVLGPRRTKIVRKSA